MDDAFTLALIVQRPIDNKDLIPMLSFNAKPIGMCLIGATVPEDYPDYPELSKTLDMLKQWAMVAPERKKEYQNDRRRKRNARKSA